MVKWTIAMGYLHACNYSNSPLDVNTA